MTAPPRDDDIAEDAAGHRVEVDAVAELSGALHNLVHEVRAATAKFNGLGLKANVALRVADTVLKRYPPRTR